MATTQTQGFLTSSDLGETWKSLPLLDFAIDEDNTTGAAEEEEPDTEASQAD